MNLTGRLGFSINKLFYLEYLDSFLVIVGLNSNGLKSTLPRCRCCQFSRGGALAAYPCYLRIGLNRHGACRVDTERASLLLSDAKSGHSLFAQQNNVLPHPKKRKNPFHWTTFIILSCCGKNVRKEIYSKLNCHGQRELSEITMSLILFPTFYPPPLSSLHALMCTYSKASNLIHLPLSVSDLLT